MTRQHLPNKGNIIIYKTSTNEVELDVRLNNETVWLNLNQIAKLFDTDKSGISRHINNIYKSGELVRSATVAKIAIVQKEGNRQVHREVECYNLDMIISVGYRVNSRRATQFRIWATKTLKQYLLKGYAVNEKRLLETQEKFNELRETIEFLKNKSQKKLLKGQEAEILQLLSTYTRTLSTLEAYDKGTIKKIKGTKTKFVLDYNMCKGVIVQVKKELMSKKQASDLFGHEREGSFKGIVRGLYQTFSGKELYPTIEDKAAHLLYFGIKDHPFSDGNKRVASFLFVLFLDKVNYLYRKTGEKKINDNALTTLALLIAESDPKEKETMIKLTKYLISK